MRGLNKRIKMKEIKSRLKKWIDCINCEDCLESIEDRIIHLTNQHNSDLEVRKQLGKKYKTIMLNPLKGVDY